MLKDWIYSVVVCFIIIINYFTTIEVDDKSVTEMYLEHLQIIDNETKHL